MFAAPRAVAVALALALLPASSSPALAQSTAAVELEDVAYLTNGGILRGRIVERVEGESILIRTHDGNQFRIPWAQISRLAHEAPVVNSKVVGLKNPWAAGGLNLIMPGLGQIYNGQLLKGGAFIFLGSYSYQQIWEELLIECLGQEPCRDLTLWAGVFAGTVVLSIVDGVVSANRHNARVRAAALVHFEPRVVRPPSAARSSHVPLERRAQAVSLISIRW